MRQSRDVVVLSRWEFDTCIVQDIVVNVQEKRYARRDVVSHCYESAC